MQEKCFIVCLIILIIDVCKISYLFPEKIELVNDNSTIVQLVKLNRTKD